MTKTQYDNYNGLITCKKCNGKYNKDRIKHNLIQIDGTINECKVCSWFKRNNNKTKFIGFTDQEIRRFVTFFIYQESVYLNDIANELNKTIDDILPLWDYLKIGNKKCLIKTTCECCGSECYFNPRAYKQSKYHYCSNECYYKDKTTKVEKGENNPSYKRIICNCTNCNKEILVIPYDYNKTNSFGDNHNFCSQECYWEYRSKYYINEKSGAYNRKWTDEEKYKSMKSYLERIKNVDYLNTSIQKKIDHLLFAMTINYNREEVFDYYSVDNYLYDNNGIIEVMGDYWHSNPIKYNEHKHSLNHIQEKQLHRDKLKLSYIYNKYGINILYLWESDINNNIELCMLLIHEYIKNQCILENYHSFNWHIDHNGYLRLNEEIIIPYQNMKVEEYRYLIKKIKL